jgi:phosphoglycerate dehydrogenase-like enzyme
MSGAELRQFTEDAEGLIIGLETVDKALLDNCSHLEFISKYGVGLDNLDLKLCAQRKIGIGWTGGVNKLSVAELAVGSMLALCRNFYVVSNKLKRGQWDKSGGFQLSGKTVGIIGFGHIGQEVARLLKPFDCRILVNDILDFSALCAKNNFEVSTQDNIFRNADFITVHTPLTEETKHMIRAKTLAMMKPRAYVLNTARGDIVHLPDLKTALKEGMIAGASIDVYPEEPPTDRELLELPNLICTAHIGGNASEAIQSMGQSAITHLKEYFLR